jgi:hypothetical protein
MILKNLTLKILKDFDLKYLRNFASAFIIFRYEFKPNPSKDDEIENNYAD